MTIRIQDYPFLSPEENAIAMNVSLAVVEGIAPFHIEGAELFAAYDIDMYCYVLRVDVRGKNWALTHKENYPVDEMVGYRERAIRDLSDRFRKAFQKRDADPIPNNVVLGEN